MNSNTDIRIRNCSISITSIQISALYNPETIDHKKRPIRRYITCLSSTIWTWGVFKYMYVNVILKIKGVEDINNYND